MSIGSTASRVEAIIRRVLTGTAGKAQSSMDALEPRCMLAGTPLPTLGMLESSNNTVVRFETSMGDVDIELFNSQAPITVANFLNYVTTGRYDNTIFHRNAISPNPFVLQGGGFSYSNTGGLTQQTTDAPIVRETTGKLNVARTLSMARTGAINSATNQFFINYVTNSFLDPTSASNGYAVFGRVIQGWDVVTGIQNLRSLNQTGNTSFSGSPAASAMNEFPVTNTYVTGAPITEAVTIRIINAEIIKPAAVNGFFSQSVVMPEGFRSARTTETMEIFNPNSATATYQVIARFENGSRDKVIFSGSLSSGTTRRLRISDAGDSTLNVVRSNTPYSLILQTALPNGTPNAKPVSGTVNRTDYNASTAEAMFNPAGYSDTQLRTWDFARVERAATSREFLSWVNLDDSKGVVTVTLLTGSSSQTFTFSVGEYRRGGMSFFERTSIPAGVKSIRLTSTVPIAAFMSDWDVPAAGQAPATSYTPGFGTMGLPGGGATSGGIAEAVIRTNFSSILSISNPTNTLASVTLKFWRTGRAATDQPITRLQSVSANSRFDFVMTSSGLGIALGENFTVTYSSGNAAIALQYTSFDTAGRNQSGTKKADGISTMFAARLAPVTYFTGGQIDPTRNNGTQAETLSIFNPFAGSTKILNYTVRYHFSDGTSIDAFTGQLGANQRATHATLSSTAVRNKANSGGQFRNYTISVLASTGSGQTLTTVAGLVQLTRMDTTLGRSVTTTGSASGFGFSFGDSIFQ